MSNTPCTSSCALWNVKDEEVIRHDFMRIQKGNPLLGCPYVLAAYHTGVYTPREIAKFCRFGLPGLVG